MMISATIQGKSVEDNHTTAYNGKLITGDMQKKCIDDILNNCGKVDTTKNTFRKLPFRKLSNNKFFCVLYHPQKDDWERARGALIVWDKETDEKLIQNTLEVMGLKYGDWVELKKRYVSKTKSTSIFYVVAVVIIIALVYILLKK